MDSPACHAVERWMKEHGPRVMAIAEAFAEGPVTADDIFQETFVTAWKKAAEVPSGPQAGAWLYQVALNIGRDQRRRRLRRESLIAGWITRARPTPSHTIDQELDRLALWRAIASLPARRRQVLLLRVAQDVSTEDISVDFGISEATVRATLRDALKSVRRTLRVQPSTPSPQPLPRTRAANP